MGWQRGMKNKQRSRYWNKEAKYEYVKVFLIFFIDIQKYFNIQFLHCIDYCLLL